MISSTYMSFFKAHYCILLDIVISSPILGSHESSASRRSHKKRIMLFRASARLQVRCDLCSQKTSLRHFTWSFLLQKKHISLINFCCSNVSNLESGASSVFKFLVFWCTQLLHWTLNSFRSFQCFPSQVTVRALQPWAEYHPKQMRTKRMSIMMKCMTLRPAQGEKMWKIDHKIEWIPFFSTLICALTVCPVPTLPLRK